MGERTRAPCRDPLVMGGERGFDLSVLQDFR
jgi:hypothetical protein